MTTTSQILKQYSLDDLDASSLSTDVAVERVMAVLTAPYLPALSGALVERYATASFPQEVAGPLGFYHFCCAATAAESSEDYRECNKWLADAATLAFIFSRYNLHADFRSGSLTLHKIGSTSYILGFRQFAGTPTPEAVVKLIKPIYWRNLNVTNSLTNVLQEYRNKDFDFTPKYDAMRSQTTTLASQEVRLYLAMDFIQGRTIDDALKHAATNFTDHDRAQECLRLAELLAKGLCNDLGRLSVERLQHLDLSPGNVILNQTRRGEETVCLLDFGINHVLRGSALGTSRTFTQAAKFVAPEIRESNDPESAANATSDVYSVGLILLELSAGCDPALAKADAREFIKCLDDDPQPLLDRIRPLHHGLAHLLESMLDRNEQSRVFEWRGEQMYARLGKDLNTAFAEFAAAVGSEWKNPFVRVADDVEASRSSGNLVKIFLLLPQVFTATGRVAACRQICLIVSGLLLAYGAKVVWTAYQSDKLRDDWPGLLVAITFTVVATKYYQSLYSAVSASDLGWSEVAMRLNCITFALPIYWTLLHPNHWAICSAIGVLFVSINNSLAYRLAQAANVEVARPALEIFRPSVYAAFLVQFDGWFLMTAIYLVFLVVIQALLYVGVNYPDSRWGLRDEWFYAVAVTMINGKMYLYNCTKEAPQIRMCLLWATDNMRRARKFRAARPDLFGRVATTPAIVQAVVK